MLKNKIKIIFAGGGTGGHLFPAINMAKALEKEFDAEIKFIGASGGIEKDKVPQAGFDIKLIPVVGFQRKLTMKNLMFPFKLFKSMSLCKKEMVQFKPDLVVGTGGYVTGPVLKTAVKMGIPTVLQEQNSYPGLTIRLLAEKVDLIFLAYKEAIKYLKNPKKTVVCGNPLLNGVKKTDRESALDYFNLAKDRKTILVLGGSQGAASLNRTIARLLKEKQIPETHQLLWQTGKRDYEKYKNEFKGIKIFSFIDEMGSAYSCADFAICRSGAMTLSELSAYGVPAILVPFPFAAADHQYKNALAVEKHGGAQVVKDDDKLYENIIAPLKKYSEDESFLKKETEKMAAQYRGDAMPVIIEEIKKLLENRGVI
jgi:UDP-N-acetylglucosamine--N-acetylmuramyl-(pentapeptide) pyrophosphoryl-undecaprenol N-acetylglucosamine transferase